MRLLLPFLFITTLAAQSPPYSLNSTVPPPSLSIFPPPPPPSPSPPPPAPFLPVTLSDTSWISRRTLIITASVLLLLLSGALLFWIVCCVDTNMKRNAQRAPGINLGGGDIKEAEEMRAFAVISARS
jgi:hypothetical protein